jgi:copper(I)-binding protein
LIGRIAAAALAALAIALGLAACGGSDSSTVEVDDPWARTSAAGQTAGAIYMKLTAGDEADRLVSASVSSDIAGETQLHETVMADASTDDMSSGESTTSDSEEMTDTDEMDDSMGGEMTMREVDGIDIPAGETVALKPGGYHIMLLDLAGPLKEGLTFDVELEFENAGSRTVEVTVRNA